MKSIKSAYAFIRKLQRDIKHLKEALAAASQGDAGMAQALLEAQAKNRSLISQIMLAETQLDLAHSQLKAVKDALGELGVQGSKRIRSLEHSVSRLVKRLDETEDELEDSKLKFFGIGALMVAVPYSLYTHFDYLSGLIKQLV